MSMQFLAMVAKLEARIVELERRLAAFEKPQEVPDLAAWAKANMKNAPRSLKPQ